MCRRGESVDVTMVPVMVSPGNFAAEVRWKMLPIDECIAELVRALNAAGHPTTAACCGHGDEPGIIGLADGRALVVIDTEGRPLGNIANDLGKAMRREPPVVSDCALLSRLGRDAACDAICDIDDSMWGCPGWCPLCKKPWEHVRPGKSQPACDCDTSEVQ